MKNLFSFVLRDSSLEGGYKATVPNVYCTTGSETRFEAVYCKTAAVIADVMPSNATPQPRKEDSLSLSSSPSLPALAAAMTSPGTNGSQTPGGIHADQSPRKADSIQPISAQTQSELERVSLHASAMVATAEKFRRRRQSLIYLLYRGLTEMYRDMRAGARRAFVSECAADIGRIKQTGSSSSGDDGHDGDQIRSSSDVVRPPPVVGTADISGVGTVRNISERNDNAINRSSSNGVVGSATGGEIHSEPTAGIGPQAAGCREKTRAIRELKCEAARVARFDKLQREVLRRSTAEVINLLEIDSLRPAPIDGGGRGGAGPIQVTLV